MSPRFPETLLHFLTAISCTLVKSEDAQTFIKADIGLNLFDRPMKLKKHSLMAFD